MPLCRQLELPWNLLFGDREWAFGENFEAAKEDECYLTKTLPTSLKRLKIDCGRRDYGWESCDEQLREMMRDGAFSELREIRIERDEKFSASLRGLPWTSRSEDGKYYGSYTQVLTRKP